jgi:hypothetical protein
MYRNQELYQKLFIKEPFCFLKINDGECNALQGRGNTLSRGDEISTDKMCTELRKVVSHQAPNFFVGHPCPICDSKNFQIYKTHATIAKDPYLSNLFINSNFEESYQVFKKTFRNWSTVVIVLNSEISAQNRQLLLKELQLTENQVDFKYVSAKNCFDESFTKYNDYGDFVPYESLCLFLCGPLGRVLAKSWFQTNNSLTCLELGSFFDPILRKKSYLYQTGSLRYCTGCNPIRQQHPSSMVLQYEPLEHECIYIYDKNAMIQYYNHDYHAIFNNSQYLSRNQPEMTLWKELQGYALAKIKKSQTLLLRFGQTTLTCEKSERIEKSPEIDFHVYLYVHDSSRLTSLFHAIGNSKLYQDKNFKGCTIGCATENWKLLQSTIQPHFRHATVVHPVEDEFEFYDFIQKASQHSFLYYHTAHQSDVQRDYLQYFLFTKYRPCLSKLEYYDVVGCNFYSFENDYIEKPFHFRYDTPIFSGNCFWCDLTYFRSLNVERRPNVALELLLCRNPSGRFFSFHTSGYDFVLQKYPNREGSFSIEDYEDHDLYQLNYVHLKKTRHVLLDLLLHVFQTYSIDRVASLIRFQECPLLETFLPKKQFVSEDDAQMTISSTRTFANVQLLLQNTAPELSCVYFNSVGNIEYVSLSVDNCFVDISQFSFYREWNESTLLQNIHVTTDPILLQKLCLFYIQRFDLEIDTTYLQVYWKYLTIRYPDDLDKQLSMMEKLYHETTEKEFILNWLAKRYENQTKVEIPKQIFFIHIDQRPFQEYNYTCIHRCCELMGDRFRIVVYNDRVPLENPWWKKLETECPTIEFRTLHRLDNFRGYPIHHVQYEADVHRMNILYEHGGIYMDTDMYLLKAFDSLLEQPYQFMISKERPEENGLINSILFSSPKNEFLRIWQNYFDYGLRKNIWAYHIRETNRLLLEQRPYLMKKYRIKILESKHFFPYSWQEHDKIMDISSTTFDDEADHYGIHLFETIKNDCLQNHPFLCPSTIN